MPIAVALALLLPASAAADADPASDVLLYARVFYPYSPAVSRSLQDTLNAETAAARRAGFPIKVALIGHAFDLGGIPEFFGKPRPYARFLDTEISYRTLQPVLVVMAAGLGGEGLGAPATLALAKLPRPPTGTPNALAQAAITDIPKLAKAAGHPIATGATGGSGSASTPLLIAAAVALALALAVAVLGRRTRHHPR
jgi:hypothetical protein